MSATGPQSTREIALDASVIINLSDGQVLRPVLALPNSRFVFGPIVEGEIRDKAAVLVKFPTVRVFDGSSISALEFIRLQTESELGPGETECVLYAKANGCFVASDDRRAREYAATIVGRDRITGTLGLLREAVAHGLMTQSEAWAAYIAMIDAGAFLPRIADPSFFSGTT